MDFVEMASHLMLFWCLGLFVAFALWKSGNKDLLRVEKKPLMKWAAFIFGLTIYRLIIFRYFSDQQMIRDAGAAALSIPWPIALLVFWEDLTFAVPLVLISRLISNKWYYRPIYIASMAILMLAFGSGHIYQGLLPALLLSLYVPFSVSRGKSVGFGTVILCHMMYDLSTILALRLALGGV